MRKLFIANIALALPSSPGNQPAKTPSFSNKILNNKTTAI